MIANAGIPSKAGGLDDKLEDWQRVVDVDFSGAYYCARIAGQIFRRQGSGNLIFTASMSGHAANVPQQQVSCNRYRDGSPTDPPPVGLLQCVQGRCHPLGQVTRRGMG